MGKDLRFAIRMMHKNTGSTTFTVISLALGIGANTAILSAINGSALEIPLSQKSGNVG